MEHVSGRYLLVLSHSNKLQHQDIFVAFQRLHFICQAAIGADLESSRQEFLYFPQPGSGPSLTNTDR